jgi:hypothetical protein
MYEAFRVKTMCRGNVSRSEQLLGSYVSRGRLHKRMTETMTDNFEM